MKRSFYLIALLLFASFSASAGVVPMTRAKAEAERFLKDVAPARSPKLQLMFESPRMTKAGLTDPEYFIFEDARGGYVIAAGDDAVPPVLGYSTSEFFRTEEMPENLRAWLDMWTDIVDEARLRNAAPYTATTKPTGRAKLLKTALWGQSAPYNNHCVEVNGKRSVTGCTATATAILMRYHKWPKKGKGTIPSYTFEDSKGNSHTVSSIPLGHPYDWDNMPLYDPSEEKWTDDQKEEVSILMQELGVMLQSNYAPSGTSASSGDIGPCLAKYMDYDAGVVYETKSMYANVEDWVDRIIKNIDEIGPVAYRASSPEQGGHAFILDGYDENGFVHVNWGWNGSGNGYYVIPVFDDFTDGHGATFGAKKNAGGTAQDMLQLYESGLSCSVTEFAVGVPFELSCPAVLNVGASTFDGEVAFVRVDRFGRMVEQVSEAVSLSLDHYYYRQIAIPCEIKTPIQAGDKVQLMLRSAKTPSWTAVRSDYEAGAVAWIQVGDVPVETFTSLSYSPATGILTVSFSDEASCELRRGSSVIRDGVSETGREVQIDANQLAPSSYTLRLKRGGQVKDITLKFGLKK